MVLAGVNFTGCDETQSISIAKPTKQVKHAGGPMPFGNARDLAARSVAKLPANDSQQRQIKGQLETNIIDLLACYDPQERANAAKNLGELRKPQACDALVLATDDSVPAVQVAAIEALGWIGDKTTALPVAKKLTASQSRVRVAAAKAFGRLGQHNNAKMLHPFFTDRNVEVRSAVIRSAGVLRDRSAVNDLARVLQKDPSPVVRSAAAGALGQIATPSCFAPLISALKDSNSQVRYLAIGGLKNMRDKRAAKYLQPLKNDSDPAVASYARDTIKLLGG